MRDKQHLGCLRIREGVITLEKLFFHDEIRPVKEIAPRKAKVPEAELKMATSLIAQFKTSFEPERYDDTYRDALMKVIKAKQKGETITAVPRRRTRSLPTCSPRLKASVDAAKKGKRSVRSRRPAARRKPPRASGSREALDRAAPSPLLAPALQRRRARDVEGAAATAAVGPLEREAPNLRAIAAIACSAARTLS
jgi:DNA end-binding protein Ku